jgi:hypothetical protein
MKKLLLSILTLISFSGFSQWANTSNITSGDVITYGSTGLVSDVTTSGLFSTPDGATFNTSNTGVPAAGLRFGTVSGSNIYAYGGSSSNSYQIYTSTTGNNWSLMTSAITSTDVIKSMTVLNGTVMAVSCPISSAGFKIWKLSGSSWVLQSSQSSNLVAVLRGLNGSLYAGTTGTCVLRSTDGGVTFTNYSTGLPTGTIFDKYINALGGTSTTLFTGSQFGKIFKQAASSTTWTPAFTTSNGSTNTFINEINVYQNMYVTVASDSGFIYSGDGGTTWAKNNAGLSYPAQEYNMKRVSLIGNYLVAAIYSSSPNPKIMRRLASEIFPTIGINETDIKAIESKAYPNPCKGEVTIEANELYFWAHTNVKVYDVLGKEIGVYQMTDGKAQINTISLPQGIYSYHVFNEGKPVSTGKILVQ